MKESLTNYIKLKKEFEEKKRSVEEEFNKFLTEIPNWRDRISSIIITYGLCIEKLRQLDDIGDCLIPKVRDIDFSGKQISFKIQIGGLSNYPEYIDIRYFPFDLLTGEYKLDTDYLNRKLDRRKDYLSTLEGDLEYTKEQIRDVKYEIEQISKLLSEEE